MMDITKKDLNKTVWIKEDVLKQKRKTLLIDAKGQTLGRLAVKIANKLSGKDKAYYCDFWDCGDSIVVINAKDIVVTGNKLQNKKYYRYSGYKGNVKSLTLSQMMDKNPERVIELAVRGMLSKNRLRDQKMKRLRIFADANHPYNNLSLETL